MAPNPSWPPLRRFRARARGYRGPHGNSTTNNCSVQFSTIWVLAFIPCSPHRVPYPSPPVIALYDVVVIHFHARCILVNSISGCFGSCSPTWRHLSLDLGGRLPHCISVVDSCSALRQFLRDHTDRTRGLIDVVLADTKIWYGANRHRARRAHADAPSGKQPA